MPDLCSRAIQTPGFFLRSVVTDSKIQVTRAAFGSIIRGLIIIGSYSFVAGVERNKWEVFIFNSNGTKSNSHANGEHSSSPRTKGRGNPLQARRVRSKVTRGKDSRQSSGALRQ